MSLPDLHALPLEVRFALASAVTGLAIGGLAWVLARIMTAAPREPAAPWEFESVRRERVREMSTVYRLFEPLVRELATGFNAGQEKPSRKELSRRLAAAGLPIPWTPEEFLAVIWVQAFPIGLAGAAIAYFAVGAGPTFEAFAFALIGGVGAAWLYQHLTVRQTITVATRRADLFKRRLPFAIDLMAFMMEAGASFLDALQTVVSENRRHPIGEEFGMVVRQVTMGQGRREALERVATRLKDEDVDELIRAINHGEDMGTPLTETLRSQADQMRQKRAQWGEKAAAEAQVAIVFPGMLIMLACLVLISAPFLLSYLNE